MLSPYLTSKANPYVLWSKFCSEWNEALPIEKISVFSCSTWESGRWEVNEFSCGKEWEYIGCDFSRVTSDTIGMLAYFSSLSPPPSPGNNDPLIIICSLPAWQVFSWDFSAKETVQTFSVPSTTFSNPGLTEVIIVVPLKGFPSSSLLLPPLGVIQGYHVHL